MPCAAVLDELKAHANPAHGAGMARYGIAGARILGVPIPAVRQIARGHRRDHALALCLWASGIHEARILASIVDDSRQVDDAQMEAWAADFDSWDLCDQCCGNLFVKTPLAFAKALEWSRRNETFVKRGGFTLMARLAHRSLSLEHARAFLDAIEREASDERNYVKKAVNWALRDIGKSSAALHAEAIARAERLRATGDRTARWIAADALRELTRSAVRARLAAE